MKKGYESIEYATIMFKPKGMRVIKKSSLDDFKKDSDNVKRNRLFFMGLSTDTTYKLKGV